MKSLNTTSTVKTIFIDKIVPRFFKGMSQALSVVILAVIALTLFGFF